MIGIAVLHAEWLNAMWLILALVGGLSLEWHIVGPVFVVLARCVAHWGMLRRVFPVVCSGSVKFGTVRRIPDGLMGSLHGDVVRDVTLLVLRLALKLTPGWDIILSHPGHLILLYLMGSVVGTVSGLYESGIVMPLFRVVGMSFLLFISKTVWFVVVVMGGLSLEGQCLGRTAMLP